MAIFFILVVTIVFLILLVPFSIIYHNLKRKHYIQGIVKNKEKYGMEQKWRCALCNGIMLANCRLTLLEVRGVKSPYVICSLCSNNTICIDPEYTIHEEQTKV